jgi:hypothetical protein
MHESSTLYAVLDVAGRYERQVTGTQNLAIGPPYCKHWWATLNAATRVYNFLDTRRSILTVGFRVS